MPNRTREVGGGPATGLAEDFVGLLRGGIGGNFGASTGGIGGQTAGQRFAGASPMGSTMGIAGILNDILGGGAGTLGGSLNEMIQRDTERGANALRARFGASGGNAFGTPAAYAESLYRAEAAPRATMAIGNMQLQTLAPILQLMAGLSSKGISQRETITEPSPWATAAGIALPAIGTALGGPIGGAIAQRFLSPGTGGGGGGALSGWMPNMQPNVVGPSINYGGPGGLRLPKFTF